MIKAINFSIKIEIPNWILKLWQIAWKHSSSAAQRTNKIYIKPLTFPPNHKPTNTLYLATLATYTTNFLDANCIQR